MPEKKTTKKAAAKPKARQEEKVEEVKTPIIPAAQDLAPASIPFATVDTSAEDIAEDDISKEIAQTIREAAGKPDRYLEAIGRRKTAVARVRLFTKGDKEFLVNDESYQKYFQTIEDQETSVASMKKMKCLDKFRITVVVRGGGHRAQAEAIRHGTARVLVDFNQNFRKRLRKVGFLTRDPRMRERKKFGLKRARKSPQWAKR
jgi:small subunit ribosomal protein S9